MAANKGTNLKNLIEVLLEKAAEEFDGNKQYGWLSENISQGKIMVAEQEKKEFESWLGVWNSILYSILNSAYTANFNLSKLKNQVA